MPSLNDAISLATWTPGNCRKWESRRTSGMRSNRFTVLNHVWASLNDKVGNYPQLVTDRTSKALAFLCWRYLHEIPLETYIQKTLPTCSIHKTSANLINLNKSEIRRVVCVMTKHCKFNNHLHTIGCTVSPFFKRMLTLFQPEIAHLRKLYHPQLLKILLIFNPVKFYSTSLMF